VADVVATVNTVSSLTVANLIRGLFLMDQSCFVRHVRELMSIQEGICESLRNAVFYERSSHLHVVAEFALVRVNRPISGILSRTCTLPLVEDIRTSDVVQY
jgi:hypothetical protein